MKVELMDFDSIDLEIVRTTQSGLPLTSRPYLKIASELSLSEEDVFERVESMRACGFIRKIAGTPNHYKIGHIANAMTVWDVPEEDVDEVAKFFTQAGFVSHCYLRPRALPEWPYNLFAMVHGKSIEETEDKIERLRSLIDGRYRSQDTLYSKRILKKTGIRFKKEHHV